MDIVDNIVSLTGEYSVIGRTLEVSIFGLKQLFKIANWCAISVGLMNGL